jgi:hypothetical protein
MIISGDLNESEEENSAAMQRIAAVNGKEVFSDKKFEKIVNTRITFTDGSWCDIATGDVVNRGPGFIEIHTSPEAGESTTRASESKTTFGPKTFEATALEIKGVEANIDIQLTDEPEITVAIEGMMSAVDDIDVELHGETLVIKGKDGGTRISVSSGGSAVHAVGVGIGAGVVSAGISRGGRVYASPGSIIVSDRGDAIADMDIRVPKGTAVKVSGIHGHVNIGDTEGPLSATMLGNEDIKVGTVLDADLSVHGKGSILADAVNGDLRMNINGAGDICVRGGSVGMLKAKIMGAGDARFDGEAIDASLSIMGSGNIDVAHVKNRPRRNVMGIGKINIGNW